MFYPSSGEWMITKKTFDYISPEVFNSIPKDSLNKAFVKAMSYLNENHSLTTESEEYEQFKIFYTIISQMLPELNLSNELIVAYDKVYNADN